MQPKVGLRLPSGAIFWCGLMAIGALQVGGAALIGAQPTRQAERAQKDQLCAEAVDWILRSRDQVTLERGRYLVHELNCDIVRESMSPAP